LAIFGCKRVNYNEMDGDRQRLPANRNCYRLSRVSWALLKLLVFIGVHLWPPESFLTRKVQNCRSNVRLSHTVYMRSGHLATRQYIQINLHKINQSKLS